MNGVGVGVGRCVAAAFLLVACRTEQTLVTPDPHLERMLKQQKRLAYEEEPSLPHGMIMQRPPEGTTPTSALLGDTVVLTGARDGLWADRIPIPVDRPMVERGQRHFDTFCAPCHGILGNGESVVAEKMALRAPPSLQDDRIRAYAPGHIFRTIRGGYGLMPSYDEVLSVSDSWEVVAYVRALQLSRHAPIAALPPGVRRHFVEESR